ncbi:cyclic nucleotide-binding domain-containing protein [Candidatus Oscillochloris fontis]|uniref:cyclic nucleotide-binding domain-containing protein n=1 Tax=Candidatus Oscillochloris fontis TaxID=2496868 RepID=UPI00101CDDD7|nr:cyclic nucleotide-binding domain-containing protein [Candidatus Oscillochloris fontis]
MRRNYTINLALSAGLFMGETLSEVLFLSHYGVAALPLGLIGTAVLGVGTTAIYTRTLARRPSGVLLAAIIVGVVAINLLIWGAFQAGMVWAALVLFLAFRPARDLLQAQIWNYISDQYDAQEAKVRFPVISAAGRIGAIIGAATLPFLLNTVGSGGTMLAWLAFLLVGLAALLTGNLHARVRHPEQPRAADAPQLRQSPLARALTTSAALAVTLVLLLTYQTSGVMVEAYPDERQLGTIYAIIAVAANMVGWAFQTFGLPQIIRLIGVSRTNLIYPAIALAVSIWVGVTGSVAAAMAGQVVRTTLRQSLQIPAEDLLMNALAAELRMRMRAIVRGAVVPLGATIGSLLILGLQTVSWGVPIIPWLSAIIAFGTVATAVWVRWAYSNATIALAREQNPITQRMAFAGFGSADPETVKMLEVRLAATESLEDQIFLGRILIELDRNAAERALTTRIAHSPAPTQVAMLDLLGESGIAGEPLIALAPRLIRAEEPAVRRATLDALCGVRALAAPLFRSMLNDPDARVQLAAARLLLRAYPDEARAQLVALVAYPEAEMRATVMSVIGTHAPEMLITGLHDSSPIVRLAAAEAAAHLSNLASQSALVAALRQSLNDPTVPVRRAVTLALGQAGPSQIEMLVGVLGDHNPSVRACASSTLFQIGIPARAALSACLKQAGSLDQREAALVTLARLNPGRPSAELIEFEQSLLARLATIIQIRPALGKLEGAFGTLLLDDINEEEQDLLERLRRLLAASDGDDAARSIWQGLGAEERERRAQASEALENARSPWQARLTAGIMRPDRLPERVLALAAQRWPQSAITHHQAWEMVGHGSEWRHNLARAAQTEHQPSLPPTEQGGIAVLSVVEKAIFLRAVPVFADMAPGQLQILASAAEELEYPQGAPIFTAGDPADRLFVIVNGRVGIEETRARGNVIRIATLEARSPFGELAVFDAPAHPTSAIAIDACYLLAIRREVLIDLINQYPDLALTIIKFLSRRLRDASSTIAEKTRARPRQIVDLFDKMGEG